MGKVYDLSSYLEEKKSTIKLGEETFEISDGFNDLLKIDALSERRNEMSSTQFVREFLGISLGKEAAETLISRNYKSIVYTKIIECIQDNLSGDSEEEGVSKEARTELV